MMNFKDISALCGVLSAAYNLGEGAVGRDAFSHLLREQFEFDADQAKLYASTVLSVNSNGSSDWVSMNAHKLAGKWVRGDSSGSAGNLVVTKTWIWQFNEDLTYENRYETYEGYNSPFGDSYSRPTSQSEYGIWAPPDQLADEISIVAISTTGWCRPIKISWRGATQTIPSSCSVDGVDFGRQWS